MQDDIGYSHHSSFGSIGLLLIRKGKNGPGPGKCDAAAGDQSVTNEGAKVDTTSKLGLLDTSITLCYDHGASVESVFQKVKTQIVELDFCCTKAALLVSSDYLYESFATQGFEDGAELSIHSKLSLFSFNACDFFMSCLGPLLLAEIGLCL